MEAPDPEPVTAAEPEFGWDDFQAWVKRAKKVFGKPILVEAPAKSGRLWLTYEPTLRARGYDESQLLYDNGALTVAPDALEALGKILMDQVREAEKPAYAKS